MARKRADSFKIAVETLRGELRTGAHTAGARLTANEIAERLNLSQTPVREALSRLAGEGLLLDRRGQGYFVPSLSGHDVGILFQMQLELLRIACIGERASLPVADVEKLIAPPGGLDGPQEITLASERLLRAFAFAASPPLGRHLARIHDQLASVRAAEAQALDALPDELLRLSAAISSGEHDAIRGALDEFFERRISAAGALVRRQDGSANIDSI